MRNRHININQLACITFLKDASIKTSSYKIIRNDLLFFHSIKLISSNYELKFLVSSQYLVSSPFPTAHRTSNCISSSTVNGDWPPNSLLCHPGLRRKIDSPHFPIKPEPPLHRPIPPLSCLMVPAGHFRFGKNRSIPLTRLWVVTRLFVSVNKHHWSNADQSSWTQSVLS